MSFSRLSVSVRKMATSVERNIIKTLSGFSTCELSDALVKLKVPSGGHLPDIYRITTPSPSGEDGSSTLCGPAYTVKMVLSSDTESPKLTSHFVDTAIQDSVIVIDAPASQPKFTSLNLFYIHIPSFRRKECCMGRFDDSWCPS